MHSHRGAPRPSLSIVGGESLLGKEIRDLLEGSRPPVNVGLIAAEEDPETSIIATGREEPEVIGSLQAASLDDAKILLLAGSFESSRKAFERVQNAHPPPVVIDVTGALEEHSATRLRAPLVEPPVSKIAGAIQVIAHPGAVALALFLTRLRKAGPIRRSVVEVFEPASERGQRGIDELQKQTAALLSFKPLPKAVYDAQVSFNMLPEYGSDSPHSLSEIELKIDRHLASLLATAGNMPMPSLRVIHAPVFHAYSFSIWTEFDENPGREAILQALTADRIDLRAGDEEPPSNTGVAGHGGITVGCIAPDRNQPRAFWFWMAADNLRIAAENAVEVAREFLK